MNLLIGAGITERCSREWHMRHHPLSLILLSLIILCVLAPPSRQSSKRMSMPGIALGFFRGRLLWAGPDHGRPLQESATISRPSIPSIIRIETCDIFLGGASREVRAAARHGGRTANVRYGQRLERTSANMRTGQQQTEKGTRPGAKLSTAKKKTRTTCVTSRPMTWGNKQCKASRTRIQ